MEDDTCDYTATMPAYEPEISFADSDDVIYLYSNQNKAIHRWSVDSEKYIAPVRVGMNHYGVAINPLSVEISSSHDRLYLGYITGEINLFAYKCLIRSEQSLIRLSDSIGKIASAGNFIVAKEGENYSQARQVIDKNGAILQRKTSIDTLNTVFGINRAIICTIEVVQKGQDISKSIKLMARSMTVEVWITSTIMLIAEPFVYRQMLNKFW